jgi:2-keto-3-deoxy-galactonokinase
MMNDKRQTFLIPVVSGDHDNWVEINAGQQALLRVAHSAEMISRLLRQKSLPPIDHASFLLDTFALAKESPDDHDEKLTRTTVISLLDA